MDNTIINGLTTTQQRNRNLLLKALADGMRAVAWQGRFLVSSRSNPRKPHLVERVTLADGSVSERCDCAWAAHNGPFCKSADCKPCAHVLVTRWLVLPADKRETMIEIDPAFAAYAPDLAERRAA